MLKKWVITAFIVLSASILCFAQQSLSDQELQNLRQGFDSEDANNIAIMNALTANGVKELAVNRKKAGKIH